MRSPSRSLLLAEVCLVSLGVCVAVALLAWPLPVHPGSVWMGGSYNDHASIAWTLDFVARRIVHGQLPWGHTTRLEYPTGARLFPADLPEFVLLTPVVLGLGATAALNLLSVLHHGLTAGMTWGWLRSEGAQPAGAAAGALAVALAPAMVTATYNGNPDVTPWYWIPLALWVLSGRGWRRALLAGVLVALAGWCGPYAGVMGAVAVSLRLGVERRWAELGIALAVVLAGAVGVGLLTTAALDAPDAAILKGPRVGLMGTATLWGLLRPAPYLLGTDPFWELPTVATGTYLGWSLLLVAPLARERRSLGWLLLAAGLIMALGPELRLTEAIAPHPPGLTAGLPGPPPVAGGTGIPLPMALVEHLPGLGRLQLTGRYTGLAALGLAWLAAMAAPRLGRWAWALPVAVAVDLLVAAGGAVLLESVPAYADDACDDLRGLAPGAVLDLPPTYHELWLYLSLCHHRPVAEGINRPLPESLRVVMEVQGPSALAPALARSSYRWLVVHPGVPGGRFEDALHTLTACALPGGGDVEVFDLECVRRELAQGGIKPGASRPARRSGGGSRR